MPAKSKGKSSKPSSKSKKGGGSSSSSSVSSKKKSSSSSSSGTSGTSGTSGKKLKSSRSASSSKSRPSSRLSKKHSNSTGSVAAKKGNSNSSSSSSSSSSNSGKAVKSISKSSSDGGSTRTGGVHGPESSTSKYLNGPRTGQESLAQLCLESVVHHSSRLEVPSQLQEPVLTMVLDALRNSNKMTSSFLAKLASSPVHALNLSGCNLLFKKNSPAVDLSEFSSLVALDVSNISKSELQALVSSLPKAAPQLELLNVSNTPVIAPCFVQFSSMRSLHTINMSHCPQLADDAIKNLCANGALTDIDLSWCQNITNDGLLYLNTLRNLQRLDISFTGVTTKGIRALSKQTSLADLRLRYIVNSTDIQALSSLSNHLNITTLDLSNSRGTDKGIDYLQTLRSLNTIMLADSAVTDDGLEILSAFPQLHTVTLNRTRITDTGVGHLTHMLTLSNLELIKTRITIESLQLLTQLPQLQSLDVSQCELNDSAVEYMTQMPSLAKVVVRGTHITDAAFAHFAGILGLRDLHVEAGFGIHFTDMACCHLRGMSNLHSLVIGDVHLSEMGATCLMTLPALQRLQLRRSHIDTKAMPVLRAISVLDPVLDEAYENVVKESSSSSSGSSGGGSGKAALKKVKAVSKLKGGKGGKGGKSSGKDGKKKGGKIIKSSKAVRKQRRLSGEVVTAKDLPALRKVRKSDDLTSTSGSVDSADSLDSEYFSEDNSSSSSSGSGNTSNSSTTLPSASVQGDSNTNAMRKPKGRGGAGVPSVVTTRPSGINISPASSPSQSPRERVGNFTRNQRTGSIHRDAMESPMRTLVQQLAAKNMAVAAFGGGGNGTAGVVSPQGSGNDSTSGNTTASSPSASVSQDGHLRVTPPSHPRVDMVGNYTRNQRTGSIHRANINDSDSPTSSLIRKLAAQQAQKEQGVAPTIGSNDSPGSNSPASSFINGAGLNALAAMQSSGVGATNGGISFVGNSGGVTQSGVVTGNVYAANSPVHKTPLTPTVSEMERAQKQVDSQSTTSSTTTTTTSTSTSSSTGSSGFISTRKSNDAPKPRIKRGGSIVSAQQVNVSDIKPSSDDGGDTGAGASSSTRKSGGWRGKIKR